MFERMNIAESIFEGVVEPSYKKHTREHASRARHGIKNIGEAALSETHSAMGESAGKYRKIM